MDSLVSIFNFSILQFIGYCGFNFHFFIFSISVLLFKGLNLGVDFKGGTLIELRMESSSVSIGQIISWSNIV